MIAGIDLGTTNSLIGVWKDKGAVLARNALGNVLTPSVVSFDEDGTVYVGETARERKVTHPTTTFAEFKRHMGSETTYEAYGMHYTATDLSAIVLKQLKNDAESFFGEEITEAVISVPAYFDDRQRAATRRAGLLAGLKVSRLINEPSAAALAYHINHLEENDTYIVFDFGGGTLDATVIDAFSNVIEIKTISGDNKLGGKDFNEIILHDMCRKEGFRYESLPPADRAILLKTAEAVKMGLTSENEVTTSYRLNNKTFQFRIDEQRLIDLSGDLFRRLTLVLKRLMNDAGISTEGIAGLILVGGSSKMPIIRHFVGSLFPGKLLIDTNLDEIVAKGAAAFAGIKERADDIRDIVLIDICPFTLGTRANGDYMVPILKKNTTLPASREEYFQTAADNQTQLRIEILQGENLRASENLKLDEILIRVPPLPKGQVGFSLRYSYDINGLFDVDIVNPNYAVDVHRKMGNTDGLLEDEIKERQRTLNAMKIHPRNDEQNRFLIERALCLFEECNPAQKQALANEISLFEMILNTQDSRQVKLAYVRLMTVIATIEKSMFSFSDYDAGMWTEYLSEKAVEKTGSVDDVQKDTPDE